MFSSIDNLWHQVSNPSVSTANYIANAEANPSDGDLDSYFGAVNGTIGVQAYAGASAPSPNQRVWVRSSGSWEKLHNW